MPKHFIAARDQMFAGGQLLDESTREVDVTADAVRVDAHTRLRDILARNRAFLDLEAPTAAQRNQQVERNTRAMNLVIRLLLALDDANARDLIDDDPGRE